MPSPEVPLASAGKAVRGGAPSQKTCRASQPEPLAEGGFVFRRTLTTLVVAALALALAAPALALRYHVRVEGRTQTIFGAAEPRFESSARVNALDALEAASAVGEFYYHVQVTSFGAVRRPCRQVRGRRDGGLGVQGQRRLAARRRRPGRAQRGRSGPLVLGAVRRRGRAARRCTCARRVRVATR